ncbi:radical SAM family heme chaperone HemW [[Brevibacterium] frigoritolerans]|uniref:Heme chaperone HemW n=1 Tax=Peribacillus frigoritolerans TaxID=450367 RepID=A0A941FJB1_9BACI|nr:radical SAM family heme chaperone HemW [Peribacillus frigoritolerans]
MIKSAYLHIPFCEHICHYCDFNKVFLQGQPVDEYLQMMKREMVMQLSKYPTAGLDTVFVGGGHRPHWMKSSLHSYVKQSMKPCPLIPRRLNIPLKPIPGSFKEKLKILYDSGVNRLSFGVQSFNDELLKRIGRTHRASEVYETIHLAQEVGFSNISIDLIYGLPGQTMEDFKDTLDKAIALQLPHYSSYSLIVEPKTVFIIRCEEVN